jgi:hypothetical protein
MKTRGYKSLQSEEEKDCRALVKLTDTMKVGCVNGKVQIRFKDGRLAKPDTWKKALVIIYGEIAKNEKGVE